MSLPINYFANGSATVALVTGAASGIGAATVRRLYDAGIRSFVLIDRNADALRECAEPLTGADALLRAHDVADDAAWRSTVESMTRFGRLDLVVANAGVADGAEIAAMDFAAWRRIISTNLDGVFLTLKHGMALIKAGANGGAIAIVSSAAAIKAEIGTGAYAASKAAVMQLARVAAKEGAPDRIRVNTLLPGGVETPIWRDVPFFKQLVEQLGSEQAALAQMGRQMPLGRYAKADEIAAHIVYLLSDACGPMTGASIVIDSGYTL